MNTLWPLLRGLPGRPSIPLSRLAPARTYFTLISAQPSLVRPIDPLLRRAYSPASGFNPNPNPQPSFPDLLASPADQKVNDTEDGAKKSEKKGGMMGLPSMTNSPALDAALATFVGLVLVFGSGIAYLAWYKVRPVIDELVSECRERRGDVELTPLSALPSFSSYPTRPIPIETSAARPSSDLHLTCRLMP
jgi:hypothetical protein